RLRRLGNDQERSMVPELFAENFELIGYHDLGGKPGFKLAMQTVGERWYLYLGHFWEPLWTVLEVTDPAHPEIVAQVSGPANSWTLQVQVAEGRLVTALERIGAGWGGNEGEPFEEGVLVWDVKDPAQLR